MAITRTGSTSLDAWLGGGRVKHHRLHDHTGAESDLFVAIDDAIGDWLPGTPIHYVLKDLYDRVISLQQSSKQVHSFSAQAMIGWWFSASASISGPVETSFRMDACFGYGGQVSMNAWLSGGSVFLLDAIVIP